MSRTHSDGWRSKSGLLFRHNSCTGAVEVVSSKGVKWGGLNVGLHSQ